MYGLRKSYREVEMTAARKQGEESKAWERCTAKDYYDGRSPLLVERLSSFSNCKYFDYVVQSRQYASSTLQSNYVIATSRGATTHSWKKIGSNRRQRYPSMVVLRRSLLDTNLPEVMAYHHFSQNEEVEGQVLGRQCMNMESSC